MQLLQTWKESLLVFIPANFKLFFLITFKSVIETYKLLFHYFWWLIGLLLVVRYNFHFHFLPTKVFYLELFVAIFNIFLGILFCYVIILVSRSSVDLKRWPYFAKYLFPFPYFVIPLAVLMSGLYFLERFLYRQFPEHLYNLFLLVLLISSYLFKVSVGGITMIVPHAILFSPLTIFFVLFFLDSGKNYMKIGLSFIRAIKMVIVNYPFCLIIYAVVLLILGILINIPADYLGSNSLLYLRLGNLMRDYLLMLLFPIPICLFTNYYIKQVHEHFDLYFGERPLE